jgi:O-antigen ligase
MALHVPSQVRRPTIPVRFVGLGLCLTFTLFFFWRHPPASLLLLVVAAALAYLRLEIAVALMPLTFPYFLILLPLSPSGFPAFYISELGLFICLGVMVLRHLFMAEERRATVAWLRGLWRQAGRFILPALLFLVGASLAVLVSPDQHLSLRNYREQIIEPLLYFLLMLRYLRTRTDLARAVGAFILSLLVVACIGISQGVAHLTSFSDSLHASTIRIRGSTFSANDLGFLMDCAIPILLAVAFLGVHRPRTAGSAAQPSVWRDPLRWVCLVLLIPFLWALYWSDSHGAEIALLLVAFGFFAYEIRSKLVILGTGVAGIVGIVLLWPQIIALLESSKHGKFWERLTIWKASLLMIRDHILLGIGPGSFSSLYRPSAPNSYLLQALDGQTSGVSLLANIPHPHNFILDFWLSTGLLGVVAIFWLLGAYTRVIVCTYRRCAWVPQGELLQRLLLGLAGCMVATVADGMVDIVYFLSDLALIFWFFMGIVLVLHAIVQQESTSSHARTKKPAEETLAA